MLIFDSHLDLAWNAVEWGRDYTASVENIRAAEAARSGVGRGRNTVSYPELKKAEVFCSLATILTREVVADIPPFRAFETDERTVAAAGRQMAHYREMVERGQLRQLTCCWDLSQHLYLWQSSGDRVPGFILSMEGADAVTHPDRLEEWWDLGLRVIGPVHYGENRYSHGTGSKGGLKALGRDLLRRMAELGFVLDVTHLTDEAFSEAVDLYNGPILASHHNCRSLTPGQRQMSDEQITRLTGRNGVIGVVFDNWMLVPGWVKGASSRDMVTIESVVDHIDHICQLAGDCRHVGIGSDLDGGFGTEQSPSDLDTITDLQKLVPILQNRGYKTADIEGIFFRNWVRFFMNALPA